RTLRPRIDIRPRESPWEGYVRLDFQVGGSFCCQPKLVDSPYLTSRRISTNAVWSKSVEPNVIGRMDRNQLALEMGRKFSHLQAARFQHTPNLIAIAAAFRSALQIKESGVPSGNLHALVAKCRNPTRNFIKAVKRRCVTCKLGQKNGWAFN